MAELRGANIPPPHAAFDAIMEDGAVIRVRRHGIAGAPRLVLSHGNALAIDGYFSFWGRLLDRYDVIVSSLPFMNFEPEAVRRILDLYSERLTEGGVITSWDYWFREIRTYIQSASERRRMRAVLRVTREFLARHEWSRRVVLWNVPPACVYQVRHRRHEGPSLAGGPLAGPHGPTG